MMRPFGVVVGGWGGGRGVAPFFFRQPYKLKSKLFNLDTFVIVTF